LRHGETFIHYLLVSATQAFAHALDALASTAPISAKTARQSHDHLQFSPDFKRARWSICTQSLLRPLLQMLQIQAQAYLSICQVFTLK